MGRSFYTERRNSVCSLPCGNGDPSGHEAVRNGDGKTPRSKKKESQQTRRLELCPRTSVISARSEVLFSTHAAK